MEIVKTNLLDVFYKHVEEDDWLEGLDLYQAGKVANLSDYSGLLTAQIASNLRFKAEVRLKIHPNGKRIQWIECTCSKYRRFGQYCEHMAAFMINIDREKPQIFGRLDGRMPMKTPTPPSRKKNQVTEPSKSSRSLEQLEGAAQTILSHLKGSIHSVSLLAKGPSIRVRIEIKPGTITHYNLDLDSAAKFLISHPKLKVASEDIKKLKVFNRPVIRGTRFYLEDSEKIISEKVFVIKHTKSTRIDQLGSTDSRFESIIQESTFFSSQNPKGKNGLFEFISMKTAARFIGKEFLYIPDRGYWHLPEAISDEEWFDLPLKKSFKDDAAARLVADSFQPYTTFGPIWLDSSIGNREIGGDLNLSEIKVQKSSGGWFFLSPKYATGEQSISMAEMLKHYRNKKRNYIKTGDQWIKIPDFIKDSNWDFDESGKFLKVNTIGLMRLKATMGDFDSFVGSKRILEKIRNQLEYKAPQKIPNLSETGLSLRGYQFSGYEWLWWLYQNNLHGLLADEMGLGKTHQAMAILSAIKSKQKNTKFLVICPTTVIDHWLEKVESFCPTLEPIRYHGSGRTNILKSNSERYFTLVTSYGITLRDIKLLSEIDWDAVVLDEAHYIKNNVTSTYRAVCKLNSKFRLALTGTPMENHLGELKNIFDFLMPGYFGSDDYFKKNFMLPLTKGGSPERELMLQKLLYPFKMRRTKENVLTDLPPKVEDIRTCELSKQQVKLYKETLSLKAKPLIEQLETGKDNIPFLHVFHTLTLLKQICNHPAIALGDPNYENYESGKFEAFKELLSEALDSGHKIVIYSQYVKMIDIFSHYLDKINVGHICLTGQSRNRGKLVKDFQTKDEYRVFCGSLLAGGIGIDLTAASVVFHYDRWWNASKENQATDRVHRIGQNKNIQVFKFITKGSLEEKIDQLISSKQSIFEKYLEKDEDIFKKLDRRQLIDLLS